MGKGTEKTPEFYKSCQRLYYKDEASFHFYTMAVAGVIAEVWRVSLETFSTSDPKLLINESKTAGS